MRISDWSSDVCSSDLTIAGVVTRNVNSLEDCEEINRIYVRCGMVPAPVDVLWENQQKARVVTVLVAESVETGQIVGTVTGVDHERLFRSEEHTSELQSLMRISYAVFCLKKKKNAKKQQTARGHHHTPVQLP